VTTERRRPEGLQDWKRPDVGSLEEGVLSTVRREDVANAVTMERPKGATERGKAERRYRADGDIKE
jgi:hypothetical protein